MLPDGNYFTYMASKRHSMEGTEPESNPSSMIFANQMVYDSDWTGEWIMIVWWYQGGGWKPKH